MLPETKAWHAYPTAKLAVSVAALAGILYVHGFMLFEDVPVQPVKVFPVIAVAVSVGVAPAMNLPREHPTEFAGEAVAEAPPAP
jgi:IMP dehydrogenase/GMP reductase